MCARLHLASLLEVDAFRNFCRLSVGVGQEVEADTADGGETVAAARLDDGGEIEDEAEAGAITHTGFKGRPEDRGKGLSMPKRFSTS